MDKEIEKQKLKVGNSKNKQTKKNVKLESFRSGPTQIVIFSQGQKRKKQTWSQCASTPGRKPAEPGWPSAVTCVAGSAMEALGKFSSTSLS